MLDDHLFGGCLTGGELVGLSDHYSKKWEILMASVAPIKQRLASEVVRKGFCGQNFFDHLARRLRGMNFSEEAAATAARQALSICWPTSGSGEPDPRFEAVESALGYDREARNAYLELVESRTGQRLRAVPYFSSVPFFCDWNGPLLIAIRKGIAASNVFLPEELSLGEEHVSSILLHLFESTNCGVSFAICVDAAVDHIFKPIDSKMRGEASYPRLMLTGTFWKALGVETGDDGRPLPSWRRCLGL